MVKSKSEIQNLNKPELLKYALSLSDDFSELQAKVIDKLTRIESEMSITRQTNELLKAEIGKLNKRLNDNERTANNNAQYARRRQIELWNLPSTITDATDLKTEAAKILSHTGVAVMDNEIDVVHKLKKKGTIILELHNCTKRDAILRARKTLTNKKN